MIVVYFVMRKCYVLKHFHFQPIVIYLLQKISPPHSWSMWDNQKRYYDVILSFFLRHHSNPVGTEWKWKMDDPEMIVKGALENHYKMIKQFKGIYHKVQ